jgi:hypothetical protein
MDGREKPYERILSLRSKARVSSPRDILWELAACATRGRGSIPDGGQYLTKSVERYAAPTCRFSMKWHVAKEGENYVGHRQIFLGKLPSVAFFV